MLSKETILTDVKEYVNTPGRQFRNMLDCIALDPRFDELMELLTLEELISYADAKEGWESNNERVEATVPGRPPFIWTQNTGWVDTAINPTPAGGFHGVNGYVDPDFEPGGKFYEEYIEKPAGEQLLRIFEKMEEEGLTVLKVCGGCSHEVCTCVIN